MTIIDNHFILRVMNVNLTSELESYVKNKVGTGLYNSASEVVRDALRLLEEQDRIKELKLETLREDIRRGLVDLDAGNYSELTINDIKKQARANSQ